jgi:hypothetical protein
MVRLGWGKQPTNPRVGGVLLEMTYHLPPLNSEHALAKMNMKKAHKEGLEGPLAHSTD